MNYAVFMTLFFILAYNSAAAPATSVTLKLKETLRQCIAKSPMNGINCPPAVQADIEAAVR